MFLVTQNDTRCASEYWLLKADMKSYIPLETAAKSFFFSEPFSKTGY